MKLGRLTGAARTIAEIGSRGVTRLSLRFGRFAQLRPLSFHYGLDRGTPVDRFYIEDFLEKNREDVRGRVLEVGDDNYSQRFGGGHVALQDVLHLQCGNSVATITGDLADPETLPPDTFDCIVLTQTLQYVFDLPSAITNIRRSLRSGAVLLLTVPAIAPLCGDEWKPHYCWSFTPTGLTRLLEAEFAHEKISVSAAGNLYAATAFLHGASVEDLIASNLRAYDSNFPVTIMARAVA